MKLALFWEIFLKEGVILEPIQPKSSEWIASSRQYAPAIVDM